MISTISQGIFFILLSYAAVALIRNWLVFRWVGRAIDVKFERDDWMSLRDPNSDYYRLVFASWAWTFQSAFPDYYEMEKEQNSLSATSANNINDGWEGF